MAYFGVMRRHQAPETIPLRFDHGRPLPPSFWKDMNTRPSAESQIAVSAGAVRHSYNLSRRSTRASHREASPNTLAPGRIIQYLKHVLGADAAALSAMFPGRVDSCT